MSTLTSENLAKRIAEILDAYPHLKNTFVIKGVSKHSMDIKTCFIDARINYYFERKR